MASAPARSAGSHWRASKTASSKVMPDSAAAARASIGSGSGISSVACTSLACDASAERSSVSPAGQDGSVPAWPPGLTDGDGGKAVTWPPGLTAGDAGKAAAWPSGLTDGHAERVADGCGGATSAGVASGASIDSGLDKRFRPAQPGNASRTTATAHATPPPTEDRSRRGEGRLLMGQRWAERSLQADFAILSRFTIVSAKALPPYINTMPRPVQGRSQDLATGISDNFCPGRLR